MNGDDLAQAVIEWWESAKDTQLNNYPLFHEAPEFVVMAYDMMDQDCPQPEFR